MRKRILRWGATGAVKATITPDIGPVNPDGGTVEVENPTTTKIYTLTLYNAIGETRRRQIILQPDGSHQQPFPYAGGFNPLRGRVDPEVVTVSMKVGTPFNQIVAQFMPSAPVQVTLLAGNPPPALWPVAQNPGAEGTPLVVDLTATDPYIGTAIFRLQSPETATNLVVNYHVLSDVVPSPTPPAPPPPPPPSFTCLGAQQHSPQIVAYQGKNLRLPVASYPDDGRPLTVTQATTEPQLPAGLSLLTEGRVVYVSGEASDLQAPDTYSLTLHSTQNQQLCTDSSISFTLSVVEAPAECQEMQVETNLTVKQGTSVDSLHIATYDRTFTLSDLLLVPEFSGLHLSAGSDGQVLLSGQAQDYSTGPITLSFKATKDQTECQGQVALGLAIAPKEACGTLKATTSPLRATVGVEFPRALAATYEGGHGFERFENVSLTPPIPGLQVVAEGPALYLSGTPEQATPGPVTLLATAHHGGDALECPLSAVLNLSVHAVPCPQIQPLVTQVSVRRGSSLNQEIWRTNFNTITSVEAHAPFGLSIAQDTTNRALIISGQPSSTGTQQVPVTITLDNRCQYQFTLQVQALPYAESCQWAEAVAQIRGQVGQPVSYTTNFTSSIGSQPQAHSFFPPLPPQLEVTGSPSVGLKIGGTFDAPYQGQHTLTVTSQNGCQAQALLQFEIEQQQVQCSLSPATLHQATAYAQPFTTQFNYTGPTPATFEWQGASPQGVNVQVQNGPQGATVTLSSPQAIYDPGTYQFRVGHTTCRREGSIRLDRTTEACQGVPPAVHLQLPEGQSFVRELFTVSNLHASPTPSASTPPGWSMGVVPATNNRYTVTLQGTAHAGGSYSPFTVTLQGGGCQSASTQVSVELVQGPVPRPLKLEVAEHPQSQTLPQGTTANLSYDLSVNGGPSGDRATTCYLAVLVAEEAQVKDLNLGGSPLHKTQNGYQIETSLVPGQKRRLSMTLAGVPGLHFVTVAVVGPNGESYGDASTKTYYWEVY